MKRVKSMKSQEMQRIYRTNERAMIYGDGYADGFSDGYDKALANIRNMTEKFAYGGKKVSAK